jgi:hypothetical protein
MENKVARLLVPLLLTLILVALGIIAFLLYRNQQPPVKEKVVKITETSMISPTVKETKATKMIEPIDSANGSEGVLYENSEYGFELWYSPEYKVLADSENLYGYPHGVALLYQGGQAYDLVIEAWDSQAEYEAAYGSRMSDLTVIQAKGKFITILDNTLTPENQEIIATFKATDN